MARWYLSVNIILQLTNHLRGLGEYLSQIDSFLRVNFECDSNILQLLAIPDRILVPPVTHFFRSKWLHFFSVVRVLQCVNVIPTGIGKLNSSFLSTFLCIPVIRGCILLCIAIDSWLLILSFELKFFVCRHVSIWGFRNRVCLSVCTPWITYING